MVWTYFRYLNKLTPLYQLLIVLYRNDKIRYSVFIPKTLQMRRDPARGLTDAII